MLLVALEHRRDIGVAMLLLRGTAEMIAKGNFLRCDLVERCTAPPVSIERNALVQLRIINHKLMIDWHNRNCPRHPTK